MILETNIFKDTKSDEKEKILIVRDLKEMVFETR